MDGLRIPGFSLAETKPVIPSPYVVREDQDEEGLRVPGFQLAEDPQPVSQPAVAGRPTADGSNLDPRPATSVRPRPQPQHSRENLLKMLTSRDSGYIVRGSANLHDLDDQTLTATQRWAEAIRSRGYTPVISSAARTRSTSGTGHSAGAAIDVGLYTKDGGLLGDDEEEYRIVREAAREAGFTTALNEYQPTGSANWGGPHAHLSMHDEGEHLDHAHGPRGVRENLKRNGDGGLRGFARNIAVTTGVDPDILEALIEQESGFRSKDKNGNILTSSAGAMGLGQFTPETLRHMEQKYGISPEQYKTDEATQIKAAALYLKEKLDSEGDYASALAAYNAGTGGLYDMRRKGSTYTESRSYVQNILSNATGRDISAEEAEAFILNGTGPKYLSRIKQQQQLDHDIGRTSSYIEDFVNFTGRWGSNIAEHGFSDAIQGTQELIHGLTFGFSSFVPGLKPGDYWDNLRWKDEDGNRDLWNTNKGLGDNLLNLGIELPWFLGSLMAGEMLAVGMAAKGGFKGMSMLEGGGSTSWGRKLFEQTYGQVVKANGGKMGTLGRIMYSTPVNFFDNVSAHTLAFGTQAMAEGTSRRIAEGADVTDIVKGGLGDFFMGGMFGLAMGFGIPVGAGIAGHVGTGLPLAMRNMVPDRAMPTVAGAAVDAFKGAPGAADNLIHVGGRAAMRGGTGGFLGGLAGGAQAGYEGTDVWEGTKKGAAIGAAAFAGGPEAFKMFANKVSPQSKEALYGAVDKVFEGLDTVQKSILTSSVMERAGLFESSRREAYNTAATRALTENLQSSHGEIGEAVAKLESEAKFALQEEQKLVAQATEADKVVQYLEKTDPQVATYKPSYEKLQAQISEHATERQQLVEEFKGKNPGQIPENVNQRIKTLENTIESLNKESKELLKDKPGLQQWIGAKNTHKSLMDQVDELQANESIQLAKEVIPKVTKGLQAIQGDIQQQMDHLATKGLDDPLPVGDAPWELAADMDPRQRDLALSYLTQRQRAFVESIAKGPPDKFIQQAMEKMKVQTFVDPKGVAARQMDSMVSYLDKQIAIAEKARRSGPVLSKTPRSGSAISWQNKRVDGLSSYHADTAALEEYVTQGQKFVGDWEAASEQALDAIRNGEALPKPILKLIDGKIELENPESLFAARALGQREIPVQVPRDSVRAVRNRLQHSRQATNRSRLNELRDRRKALSETYDRFFLGKETTGIQTGVVGGDIIGANPNRIDYEKVISEIEQKVGIDAVYAREQALRQNLDEADRIQVMEKAIADFQANVNPEDLQEMVVARMDEYVSMFDTDNVSATTRLKAMENISKQMDRPTSEAHSYLEDVGGKLIDTFETLFWSINGKVKNKAMGVMTDSDVLGHTMQSFVGLNGDQVSIRKYAQTLESLFREELDVVSDDLVSRVLDDTIDTLDMEDAIKRVTGRGVGDPQVKVTADDIKAALTHSMDDNVKMGRLLRDVPELRPAMDAYLRHQQMWEGVIRRSPHLKDYMRPAYIMHRYKGMIEFANAHPQDADFVKKVSTRLNSETQRSFDTLEKAQTFAESQLNRLKRFTSENETNVTPQQFLSMSLDNKLRTLAFVNEDLGTMSRGRRRELMDAAEEIVTGILVKDPILDPAQLMSNKIRMTVQADTMRRFMAGLTEFGVVDTATGRSERLLALGSPVAERASSGPTVNGKPYKRVSDLPGWEGVSLENHLGESVPARNMFIHPQAAEFLSKYAHATGNAAEQNWNVFMSLLRTSTLFGTPVPHFVNTLSNNLAEFINSPAKAIGMIGAGRRIAEEGLDGTSGDFLKLYAMKAGVNTDVMTTTTRMIAQDIQKHMEAFSEDIYGNVRGSKGITRQLEAIDPMDEVRRKAARSTLGTGNKIFSEITGMLPEADYIVNRKMLFDVIEQSQLAGFFYRTSQYLEELRTRSPEFSNLPKDEQLRLAQEAAKERVNEVAGAIPYYYSQDKVRRGVYATVLTPAWFMAKGRAFVSALDASLGLIGGGKYGLAGVKNSPVLNKTALGRKFGEAIGNFGGDISGKTVLSTLGNRISGGTSVPLTRYGHLPEPTRKLYANKLAGTVAAGMAAYIAGAQVMSYMMNGHSTFENPDPGKWMHIKVGTHYYNNPMFGFFRDVAKSLGGSAAGEGIEPWLHALGKQMLPTIQGALNLTSNKDDFTGKPIMQPNAGVVKGGLQAMSYLMHKTVSFDDIVGGKTSKLDMVYQTLSNEGLPVNRLGGGEWLLRMFGVWESDYNAPARLAGDANASLAWHKDDLNSQVEQYIRASTETTDIDKSHEYMKRAYNLALIEGLPITDERLQPYFPEGRLRLSLDAFRNRVMKVQNPNAYYTRGEGKPSKEILYYTLARLQQQEAIQQREGYNYLIQKQRSGS